MWAHTNMDQVELFQDGVSLGRKDVPKDSHLQWIVTYRPGVLEARGFRGGQPVMTTRRETTGKAAKLAIRVDRAEINADGTDLAFVTAEVQDAEGRVLPVTENEVTFHVSGPARVIGTGNGDPASHEPDTGSVRKAFAGLCMGIVQATKQAGPDLGGDRFSGPGIGHGAGHVACGCTASAGAYVAAAGAVGRRCLRPVAAGGAGGSCRT